MDKATRDRLELLAIGQRQMLSRLIALDMRVRAIAAAQKSHAPAPQPAQPSRFPVALPVPRKSATPSVDKLLYDRKSAVYALSMSVRSVDIAIANKQIMTRRKGRRILIPAEEFSGSGAARYCCSLRIARVFGDSE